MRSCNAWSGMPHVLRRGRLCTKIESFISHDECILKRELQAPYLIKYGDVTVVGRRSKKEGKINVVYGYMDLGTGKKR